MLGVEKIRTTEYHPETNGCIEKMHSTLESMLAKGKQSGLDWVDQLPLALAALCQCPNRSTGFSLAEIVYGGNVRGPLDLLHYGWRDSKRGQWNI